MIFSKIKLDTIKPLQITEKITSWVSEKKGRYICFANVHMVMEAYDSVEYQNIINSADIVAPDGMPLVWIMKIKGQKNQERVYGPTIMLHVLEAAARENISVGFYGGKAEVLDLLVQKMKEKFNALNISYAFSPPFTENLDEQEHVIQEIQTSKTKILFVGLGCPKQEYWMAKYKNQLNAVMLGVGAAFDFHAGTKPQAPSWMQKIGLEWLFRLMTEPRRLWKRYLYHNPRFIYLAITSLINKN